MLRAPRAALRAQVQGGAYSEECAALDAFPGPLAAHTPRDKVGARACAPAAGGRSHDLAGSHHLLSAATPWPQRS
jgi:hypothetical protein